MPLKDPEAQRAYQRDYHLRNRDKACQRARDWVENLTPEEKTARAKRNYQTARAHPDHLARKRKEQAAVTREVIEGYGGRCACCGADYLPHLTLDHVNEDGREHRLRENSRSMFRRLRRQLREGLIEDGLQVLCWNCNIAKHRLGRCSCRDH